MNCRQKVYNYIKHHALLNEGERVLVGLSGGPDSVCLIHILMRLQFKVIALHCNFHLRDEESNRDQEFAENLCKELGIECHTTHFNTSEWAKEHKVSIEMAARELRYEYFRKMKSECKAQYIAVGHHKGDNAETMLLNLMRGTGIDGMCGIRPKNGDIIRPLLCLSREEIIDYLKEHNLAFVTDRTNLSNEYSRNKVRLDILPLMKDINSAVLDNLVTTIENMNEVRKVYEKSIEEGVERCCEEKDNYTYINIEALADEPSPISVLHEILSPKGFNRKQEIDIINSVTTTNDREASIGKIFESNEYRLVIDRNVMCLQQKTNDVASSHQISMVIVDAKDYNLIKSPNYAYLDVDKLKNGVDNLCVRCPKQGDTFAPFGMKGRRKLVSDFLTDLKLSRFEKEKQPLLCDGEEIAWVVGKRSSELYRVDDTTQRVLILCQKS